MTVIDDEKGDAILSTEGHHFLGVGRVVGLKEIYQPGLKSGPITPAPGVGQFIGGKGPALRKGGDGVHQVGVAGNESILGRFAQGTAVALWAMISLGTVSSPVQVATLTFAVVGVLLGGAVETDAEGFVELCSADVQALPAEPLPWQAEESVFAPSSVPDEDADPTWVAEAESLADATWTDLAPPACVRNQVPKVDTKVPAKPASVPRTLPPSWMQERPTRPVERPASLGRTHPDPDRPAPKRSPTTSSPRAKKAR